jgi:hypothetical protein
MLSWPILISGLEYDGNGWLDKHPIHQGNITYGSSPVSELPSYNTTGAPRFFVVIVGIANYEGTMYDLTYSDDDATRFLSYLKNAFPGEMAAGRYVMLLNSQATKQNIVRSIRDVFTISTPNDYIILYYSGHGSKNAFYPYDLNNQELRHAEVKELFSQAKAKYKLCIADACFSGAIAGAASPTSNTATAAELKNSRIAVIMSSRPSQPSIESTRLKQGLFTYYLLKGLTGNGDANNDGYIMVGELFQYVKESVARQSNNEQVPVIYGKNLNMIPMARIKKP